MGLQPWVDDGKTALPHRYEHFMQIMMVGCPEIAAADGVLSQITYDFADTIAGTTTIAYFSRKRYIQS